MRGHGSSRVDIKRSSNRFMRTKQRDVAFGQHPLARPDCFFHHRQACIMAQAKHVPGLVKQNRQQIETPKCGAARVGQNPLAIYGYSELGRIRRRHINEPTMSVGIGIDEYLVAIGLAENAVRQVNDGDSDIRKASRKSRIARQRIPDADGLCEDGGE